MQNTTQPTISAWVSAQQFLEMESWVAKYPANQRQSAVMSVLRIMQEAQGHLTTEAMDVVADYLRMPAIAVYEVASFYTMYEHAPTGRHVFNVCTNVSCKLQGADDIVCHLENKLKIKCGETTPDGRFTLRSVECLGACVHAPMMELHQQYHENLTTQTLDALLETLP